MLAPSPTISVCLSNATTGQPFISTLELRQLNGSLYYTADEASYFLSLAARINFGAPTTDPVRYFTTNMYILVFCFVTKNRVFSLFI